MPRSVIPEVDQPWAEKFETSTELGRSPAAEQKINMNSQIIQQRQCVKIKS